MDGPIVMPAELRERLLETVAARHPVKSFGYLLSSSDHRHPVDFVVFERNVRNVDGWRQEFEARGQYFRDHSDAGFVATPDESWRMQKEIWSRGMHEVALFHSHQRHPANFSGIDYELHLSRFASLWHLIVSMRNPQMPLLRAFDVSAAGVRELDIVTEGVLAVD
jgi:proteasome lid subunit RPN8/RPN11